MGSEADESCWHSEIEDWENRLLDISRRAYALEAFTSELHRVSRGKRFEVFNDIVWQMFFDSRDMFVIELASWCKGACKDGGLFGKLQAATSRMSRQRAHAATESVELRAYYDQCRNDAFARLFPGATQAKPSPQDVGALKATFYEKVKPIIDDRHDNRAHRHEGRKATAKLLELGDLRGLLHFVEGVLNDLRIVTDRPTLVFLDMSLANPRRTAEELIDTLLLGWQGYALFLRDGRRTRDEVYALMHEKHEASGDANMLFNEPPVRGALSDEILARYSETGKLPELLDC